MKEELAIKLEKQGRGCRDPDGQVLRRLFLGITSIVVGDTISVIMEIEAFIRIYI